MLAVGGALVVLLIPSHAPTGPEKVAGTEGPAQLAADDPVVKLTRADRRAIDRLLDRFLRPALEHKDPGLTWSLAGPELRSGSTFAAWQKGTTPVPYYQPREHTFHTWQTVDSGKGYVIFNLLVHPAKGSKLAPYVFSGEVVKQGGRWLANRLYTIAIMNPVTKTTHEIGPADFAAPAGASSAASNTSGGSKASLIPVVSILGLVILIPLTIGIGVALRARRWRKQVRASDRTELPALPARYRSGT
jgi:hypothetical protein